MQCDFSGVVYDFKVALLGCVHQIAGDLCLAINHDLLSRQFREIDVDKIVAIGQVKAIVQQTFGVHARIEPQSLHQLYSDLFEDPGPDASQYIVRRGPFDDDAVDACGAQQMAEEQACRPATDDRNLCFH